MWPRLIVFISPLSNQNLVSSKVINISRFNNSSLGGKLRQTTENDQGFFEKLNELRNEIKVSFKYRM
jgi:hypothetical protein